MIKVGDKVRLNIEAIESSGMSENSAQVERFNYILSHPDEVYTIVSDNTPCILARFKVDHPILGETSFFEDELILIERR